MHRRRPADSRRTARPARRGTTLVEVLTVVVVAAVAAGVALEAGGAWAPTAAEDAGRDLADVLRFARSRAVATGRRHTVLADAAAGTLTVSDAGGGAVRDPRRPGNAGPLVRNFEADHPGVALQEPLTTGEGDARRGVAFLPDGTAENPDAPGDKRDVVFWFTAPGGGGGRSNGGGGTGRLAVRVRAVGLTGQAWADGPRPQNATLGAWLTAGEPGLGAD